MSSVAVLRYGNIQRKKLNLLQENMFLKIKLIFHFCAVVSGLSNKKGQKCSDFLSVVFYTSAQTFCLRNLSILSKISTTIFNLFKDSVYYHIDFMSVFEINRAWIGVAARYKFPSRMPLVVYI